MALRTRTKMAFAQPGIDRRIRMEIADELSADDVLAFMAQSEAHRLYALAPRGDSRDPQVPSEELRAYLMHVED